MGREPSPKLVAMVLAVLIPFAAATRCARPDRTG
jgi:hypothetical protein